MKQFVPTNVGNNNNNSTQQWQLSTSPSTITWVNQPSSSNSDDQKKKKKEKQQIQIMDESTLHQHEVMPSVIYQNMKSLMDRGTFHKLVDFEQHVDHLEYDYTNVDLL